MVNFRSKVGKNQEEVGGGSAQKYVSDFSLVAAFGWLILETDFSKFARIQFFFLHVNSGKIFIITGIFVQK